MRSDFLKKRIAIGSSQSFRSGWFPTILKNPTLKIISAIFFPMAGPIAHAFSYVILSVWALRGPRAAIEALTLTVLITYLNPGIYTLSPYSNLLRWIVIGVAFIQIVANTLILKKAFPVVIIWLLTYAVVIGTFSVLNSYSPYVSLFKLFTFTIVASSVIIGFSLTKNNTSYWMAWFITFYIVVIISSFPLIIYDVGYFRNAKGFQGLLNHPQAYGVFIAPFASWLFMMIFEKHQKKKLLILLAIISMISLIATQSRTGALSFLGSVIFTIIYVTIRNPGIFRHVIIWAVLFSYVLIFFAVIMISNVSVTGKSIQSFALKGKNERTLSEGFYMSRGFLLERSMANFLKHPITGIGFGVASNQRDLEVKRDPVFGLPIGASVEKGFTAVAVLEETGVVGFVLLTILLYYFIGPVLKINNCLSPIALIMGALFVNFGEAILLSTGGLGLLNWLLLGASRSFADVQME